MGSREPVPSVGSMKRQNVSIALLLCLAAHCAAGDTPPESPGAPSSRPVAGKTSPGVPYELAGNRIAFSNWHYIQPGDLGWRNKAGQAVGTDDNEDPLDATHVAIEAPRGIELCVESPQLTSPFERPHRMILRDGAVYKGWTDSHYYESADAIHWEQKARLQYDGPFTDDLYQVFIDPSAAPDARFKAVWTSTIDRPQFEAFRAARPHDWEPRATLHLQENKVACLRGGVSADGVHWQLLTEPLVVEYCDTWNTAYYDAILKQYVLYTRQWSVGPRSPRLPPDIRNSWTGFGRRAIGRTSSQDFGRFPVSETILEPTPEMLPSEQLYTNCYTTVPGAPEQHLMFPTIWNGSGDDTTRITLATSHDGRVWHWAPGREVLRTQAFGAWNGGCIWATPNLIELPGGDWALPYLAHSLPHKYPRGQNVGKTAYAVWPRGRLICVEAADRGEFTLVPLIAPGKTLKINAVTRRTGWIKVEVAGVAGRSESDCAPIVGDQHWTPVAWNGDTDLGIGNELSQPLVLRIKLYQAKLYGLQFD